MTILVSIFHYASEFVSFFYLLFSFSSVLTQNEFKPLKRGKEMVKEESDSIG